MQTFLDLEHMSLVKSDVSVLESENRQEYFIPHHGVFQNEKNLRVVINASERCTNNLSLNDYLLTGQSLQSSIVHNLVVELITMPFTRTLKKCTVRFSSIRRIGSFKKSCGVLMLNC